MPNQVSRVRVLEYNDGITYVYPWSDHIPPEIQLTSIIKSIMKHRDIEDLSNTYAECAVYFFKSVVYDNIIFTKTPEGSNSCASIDQYDISPQCSNCDQCIMLNIN